MTSTSAYVNRLFSLEGKAAFVTGGSSGFGVQFAKALAAAGATVVIGARRLERLTAVADEIRTLGGKAHAVQVDVTDSMAISHALDEATAVFGPPDIVVNNAGAGRWKPFVELTEDDWEATLGPNLTGVRRFSLEAAKRLIAAGKRGSFITTGSALSFGVRPRQAAYATSKAAVLQLTRAMAADLWPHGIRVNALCPGYFVTELNEAYLTSEAGKAYIAQSPPRRLGEISELLGPLILLASDASSYMTGAAIVVDGGHITHIV